MKKITVSLDSNTPIPEFSLPSAKAGALLGPNSFKQESNLLLFFFHSWSCGHCRRLLRELKEHAKIYRGLDTKILAIAQTPLGELAAGAVELSPDITMLYDEGGKVTDAYRADMVGGYISGDNIGSSGHTDPELPFLVIADRYGAFFARMELEPGEDLDFNEIEATLMFIETQCPECGRPDGDI